MAAWSVPCTASMADTSPASDRPRLAPGYGVDPAAIGGVLPWSYVTERMERSRNYWVATTRPDGRPHVVPVWGLWLDGVFAFATDLASRKGRNLAARPEMVVHLESGDEVVILEGVAEPATDPGFLARFADAYQAKYAIRPDVSGGGTFRLCPRAAFAWRERDFPASATRWMLEQA